MGDTDAGTGRWLTYDEIAVLRGIKRIGAVRLVQRYKWRRMEGNDGKARVLVPASALEPVRRTSVGIGASTTDAGSGAPDSARTDAGTSAINALRAAFQTALEVRDATIAAQSDLLDKAERRAEEANKRADVATALADKALLQVSAVENRAEQAEIRAKDAQDRAIRAESDLAAERNRADRLEVTQDQLETGLEAAQIGLAEAQMDAAKLRKEMEAQKARGRWARLRAAWRGE
jgi:hypothetical protein